MVAGLAFSAAVFMLSPGNHWLPRNVYLVMDPSRVHQSAMLQVLI
jgi:hypothetical protein